MITMPHWPVPNWLPTIALGLERIITLLEVLGNPHTMLPPVIHVAGTNGKGSTVAFLRSIMEASGRTVHVYTSPHLVRFNERIVLRGKEIDDDALYTLLEECRLAAASIGLEVTFFEGTTAAAFLAFARNPADVLILETGMGGRLDATNVIPSTHASIITSIGYDHTEFLGTTLAAIAQEKCGILRPGRPCISSLQTDEADEAIQQAAAALPCPLIAYGYDWGVTPATGGGMVFQSEQHNITIPHVSLAGSHQYINAGNAIAASLLALPEFRIQPEHVIEGIANARWPGRLQRLQQGKIAALLQSQHELWIDGAHNSAGSQVLAAWLADQPKMPTYLILGMTKKRDVAAFLTPLLPYIEKVAGVLVEAEPSSYPGAYIAGEAEKMGISAQAFPSVAEAVTQLQTASPIRILITGSLYLAGDVLAANNGFNGIA